MSEHEHLRLAAYYDGELAGEHEQQVQAHLAECADCREELARLEGLRQALLADRLPEQGLASQEFWNRLEPRLPDRPVEWSPARWLPGLGLLLAGSLAQILGAATVLLIAVAGRLPWLQEIGNSLNGLVLGRTLGLPVWWTPPQWSDFGLALFFGVLSAWLAVLYLVWLGYEWQRHEQWRAAIAA